MFRPARITDAPQLLAWRQQAEQRNDHLGTPVTPTQHLTWLRNRLANPLISLLVWEENLVLVGMVRIDSNGELAFHAETDEVAAKMLAASRRYASFYGGRLKASVDDGDTRTWQLLEEAGFVHYPEVRFLAYKP